MYSDEADVKGHGKLGPEEVYTLVLRFYIFVAQYTLVVARQVPTREDVQNILSHGNINTDKDGVVGFDEFKTVILLLFKGVAIQLCAQLLFTMLLSPLLALGLMFLLKHLFAFFPFLLAQFWFIPSFLRNEKVGLLCFVPAINTLVVPYYLEYVFYIQSLRRPDAVYFVPDMSQFQAVPSALNLRREGDGEQEVEEYNNKKEMTQEGVENSNDADTDEGDSCGEKKKIE